VGGKSESGGKEGSTLALSRVKGERVAHSNCDIKL